MIKIKNRCCYTVTLILCGTLFLTGLTGCKSREAQFLIDGLQEAKAEVDAESSEEKTSGQKSKKDTTEKKADTEDRQNDDGSSVESRKKQAESDGSDAGNGTGSDSGKHTSDADIDNGSEAVSDKEMQQAMIYVDVCGAVANPGVFQLAAGSRVFQAIEAAGGYLPEAALTCVNRAGVLTDGQQLYILTQEEMERQGLDPAVFILDFAARIYHVHVKDAKLNLNGRNGILGSHITFGDQRRGWNFVSPGHGDVDFDNIIRALNQIGYDGPLSVEWEDSGMQRNFGGKEACEFTKKINFMPSDVAFDDAIKA